MCPSDETNSDSIFGERVGHEDGSTWPVLSFAQDMGEGLELSHVVGKWVRFALMP